MKKLAANVAKAKQAIESEKCRRSAQYFIFDHGGLVTKDEHDLQNPIKPFPKLPYLRFMLDCLLVSGRLLEPESALCAHNSSLHAGNSGGAGRDWLRNLRQSGILAIEKSRQMMVTWLVCAYCFWRAKYLPHQLILIQSKREDDAANLVFVKEPHVARISFMEWELPRHLKSCQFPRAGTYGHLYFPNGSHIWAIPEGGDIIRSNTPSVVYSDESAYQPEFGASFTAALPAIKGGGQYICVSSAEPGEFQTLVEAT